jgi:uncharacterized protein
LAAAAEKLRKIMKTGTANLRLHGVSAPPWLFKRMRLLAGEIVEALVYEHGPEKFLRCISDPYWFQAFSCVLGFDWHSSGTTAVTTGALKMALSPQRQGIAVAGGRGKTSSKAPSDIQMLSNAFSLSLEKVNGLVRASRMSAKWTMPWSRMATSFTTTPSFSPKSANGLLFSGA